MSCFWVCEGERCLRVGVEGRNAGKTHLMVSIHAIYGFMAMAALGDGVVGKGKERRSGQRGRKRQD